MVVGSKEVDSRGRRISQWSSGESVGRKVGVRGPPMVYSDVAAHKSVRGWWWEL